MVDAHMRSRRMIAAFVAVVAFGVLWPSAASADVEAAMRAYKSGDYATAFTMFTQEAKAGRPTAVYALGLMYAKGQGTKEDQATAVKLFRLAAQAGIVAAQRQMAIHYVKGAGVPRDQVMALMWFDIAAANGDVDAMLARDAMELQMPIEDVDKAMRSAGTWMNTYQRSGPQGGGGGERK